MKTQEKLCKMFFLANFIHFKKSERSSMNIKFQIFYIWYTIIGMYEYIYFTYPISPVLIVDILIVENFL
jgi:hypothetical protein